MAGSIFPSNPSFGDTFPTVNSKFVFNGEKWLRLETSSGGGTAFNGISLFTNTNSYALNDLVWSKVGTGQYEIWRAIREVPSNQGFPRDFLTNTAGQVLWVRETSLESSILKFDILTNYPEGTVVLANFDSSTLQKEFFVSTDFVFNNNGEPRTNTAQWTKLTDINQIKSNTTNIATNTANIATNTASIATISPIATAANNRSIANATNIATNTQKADDNTTNITTNTTNIAANTTNIATNTASLISDRTDIVQNTGDIDIQRNRINVNVTEISELRTQKQDELIAGEGITITDNGDKTATITSDSGSTIIEGGTLGNEDIRLTFDVASTDPLFGVVFRGTKTSGQPRFTGSLFNGTTEVTARKLTVFDTIPTVNNIKGFASSSDESSFPFESLTNVSIQPNTNTSVQAVSGNSVQIDLTSFTENTTYTVNGTVKIQSIPSADLSFNIGITTFTPYYFGNRTTVPTTFSQLELLTRSDDNWSGANITNSVAGNFVIATTETINGAVLDGVQDFVFPNPTTLIEQGVTYNIYFLVGLDPTTIGNFR